MKILSKTVLFVMFLWSSVSFAQRENLFHDRAFWKTNPSLETVKQQIAAGNDATALNINGFDAVVYALLEKVDDRVVKYLLTYKENPVNKKTHDSRIYLHWAAYAGQVQLVEYLLSLGSSVTEKDSHGYTPLAFAVNAGQLDHKLFRAFESNGVNLLEQKNEDGANLLLLAAPHLEDEEALSFFTDLGFDLNSKDLNGNGVFNYAIKKASIDFLKLLIHKGVEVTSLNNNDGNALMFAAQGTRGYSNPLSVYQFLKELGIAFNVVAKNGNTPLHRLAYNSTDTDVFELFITAGASVDQKDAQGNTPFLNAAARNELGVVRWLFPYVKDINTINNKGQNALMLAVQHNSPELVSFLLQQEADPNIIDASGNSLAFYLAKSFNIKKISDFDAKLNMLEKTDLKFNTTLAEGNTLLHIAAVDNNLELLKRLERFKIDINAVNKNGFTALHLAAMKANNDQMMKYLISKGADVKIKTAFEETAFDLATENELLEKQQVSLSFLK
jgi:ankyrin repeat protein